MNLENSKIVVTGVSKGIGKRICEQVLEKGAYVWGWGRKAPDFEHPNFRFIATDVQSEEAIIQAAQATLKEAKNIDVLINNAGLGYFGYLEEMPSSQISEMLTTNVLGLINATKAVLPSMKKQGKGHIINISSIAGLEGMPQVAVYCASKFAVRGFTDSLFRELRTFGIKVTGIYPGSTETNFFDNAQGVSAHSGMMNPAEVAAQIVHVLETSDNFLTNQLVIRPLQTNPSK